MEQLPLDLFNKILKKADKIILFAFCFAAFGLLISVMLPCNSSHISLQSDAFHTLI